MTRVQEKKDIQQKIMGIKSTEKTGTELKRTKKKKNLDDDVDDDAVVDDLRSTIFLPVQSKWRIHFHLYIEDDQIYEKKKQILL